MNKLPKIIDRKTSVNKYGLPAITYFFDDGTDETHSFNTVNAIITDVYKMIKRHNG